MAMISISIDDSKVRKMLDKVSHVTDDLSKPMAQIGLYVMRATDKHFKSQSGPDGTKWKGLAKSTERQRRKGKGGGKNQILRDSGTLMKSVTVKGGTNNVFRVGKNSVEVGTSGLPYANIHQFGGMITIKRKASVMNVRLRMTPGGKLSRQKGYPNLAVFAKRNAKHYVDMETLRKASIHSINMPARPFLGLNETDIRTTNQIIISHVNKVLGGS